MANQLTPKLTLGLMPNRSVDLQTLVPPITSCFTLSVWNLGSIQRTSLRLDANGYSGYVSVLKPGTLQLSSTQTLKFPERARRL